MTHGQAMTQNAARQFCASLPKKSVLPTLSNDSRLQAFDDLLGKVQTVTNNQPVWLDIHKKATSSLGSLVVTNSNFDLKILKKIIAPTSKSSEKRTMVFQMPLEHTHVYKYYQLLGEIMQIVSGFEVVIGKC